MLGRQIHPAIRTTWLVVTVNSQLVGSSQSTRYTMYDGPVREGELRLALQAAVLMKRSGNRGGAGDFRWSNVVNDKYRGQSVFEQ